MTVNLSKNGKNKVYGVHRLVAKAFLTKLSNILEVNHIDGNKQNNQVENLEWVTRTENLEHAYRILGRKNNVKIFLGKENPLHKIVEQFSLNNVKIAEYYGTREASRTTNVPASNICICCNGKIKQAGGYIWKYKEE